MFYHIMVTLVLLLMLVNSYSASTIDQLACNTPETIFIKSHHEINNTDFENNNKQYKVQNEHSCFSTCHLNQKCKSAQFNAVMATCLTCEYSVADVNTKIKPSSSIKTFSKMKCNAFHKFVAIVDEVVDCKDIYDKGWRKTGIYSIPTSDVYEPILCEMSLRGGGWTVIQQRVDGSVDFFRNWADYKNGFGYLDGNFWYGNDRIHKLTWSTSSEIIIPLVSKDNEYYVPRYNGFKIANEKERYRLTIGHYLDGFEGAPKPDNSTFTVHNGQSFSTKDDDVTANNCPQDHKGGWWYERCHTVNLNGQYGVDHHSGMTWYMVLGQKALKTVQMMVRKK